jgi:predicted MPP superfamily phosphohydrolase
MRFFFFLLIGAALLLGIQWYLYSGIRRFLKEKPNPGRKLLILSSFFAIFNVPLIAGPLLRLGGVQTPAWVTLNIMPVFYIWHFVSMILFLVLGIGKLLKLPFFSLEWVMKRFDSTRPRVESLKNSKGYAEFNRSRRLVVRRTLTALTGAFAVGTAVEYYRKDTFDKTDIIIPVKGLPESFEGYSIGFLSDIHSGVFMGGERMRQYAEAVNSLDTDMTVVTGDFVNSSLDEVYPLKEAFKVLSARDGVYGVLGNHDYYTRRVDEVASEIEKAGIRLLRNENVKIRKGGEEIELAGVDDTGNLPTAMRYFASAGDRRKRDTARILLCHRPYFFKGAAESGYGLVLSGHTHGGQVVLGELGRDVLAPARIVSPYVAGLYTEGRARMYVSRGIGTVGVPFRFNCPPEITRVILRREA